MSHIEHFIHVASQMVVSHVYIHQRDEHFRFSDRKQFGIMCTEQFFALQHCSRNYFFYTSEARNHEHCHCRANPAIFKSLIKTTDQLNYFTMPFSPFLDLQTSWRKTDSCSAAQVCCPRPRQYRWGRPSGRPAYSPQHTHSSCLLCCLDPRQLLHSSWGTYKSNNQVLECKGH